MLSLASHRVPGATLQPPQPAGPWLPLRPQWQERVCVCGPWRGLTDPAGSGTPGRCHSWAPSSSDEADGLVSTHSPLLDLQTEKGLLTSLVRGQLPDPTPEAAFPPPSPPRASRLLQEAPCVGVEGWGDCTGQLKEGRWILRHVGAGRAAGHTELAGQEAGRSGPPGGVGLQEGKRSGDATSAGHPYCLASHCHRRG